MAKSTTKKYKEFDLEKIKRFTEEQIKSLSNTKDNLPFCYQIGKDILIGNYRVIYVDDKSWSVTENNFKHFDFFSRKNAIFYCIALHKQELQLAESIKQSDDRIARLEFEAIIYRARYKQSIKKGDAFKQDYYSSRYLDIMDKLEIVKKELKKTLNLAKYIKE